MITYFKGGTLVINNYKQNEGKYSKLEGGGTSYWFTPFLEQFGIH